MLASIFASLALFPLAFGQSLPATVHAQQDLLAGLKPVHPRLLLDDARLTELKRLASGDPLLQKLMNRCVEAAREMLDAPPVRYHIPDGKRLLGQSRLCIQRVVTMAMAWRLTGDPKFIEGAWRNLRAAASFPDWNPRHFLDTAEMTAAFAIGYDWLHPALTEQQKKVIRDAIIRLGLEPSIPVYEENRWWAATDTNWNQVCNGGMVLGALAIADENPRLAERILGYALNSIPRALRVYHRSGAYPEGPGYWQYGTQYTALTIAALRSALGHDFGLAKTDGLDRTGRFRMHMIGPTGLYFNYADCSERAGVASCVFWLSRTYDDPSLAAWHRRRLADLLSTPTRRLDRYFALEIAWYDERGNDDDIARVPPFALFKSRQDVAAARGSWFDRNTFYVGFKAGDNRTNHGHLDIGSFVLDALGVRWVRDLGGDNYNLPGYFGRQRWRYYRLTNHSHNTLVIGSAIQNPDAHCYITEFNATTRGLYALIDMTDAYRGQAKRVTREFRVLEGRALQIVDEVESPIDTVRWGVVTSAQVKLAGGRAILEQAGKRLYATILEPDSARFQVLPTTPPTRAENQNEGTRMLAIFVPARTDRPVRLSVLLSVTPDVPTIPGETATSQTEGKRAPGLSRPR